MNWKKLGIIFNAAEYFNGRLTHAIAPTPVLINKDNLRIYINCIDKSGISRPYFIEVNPNDSFEIVNVSSNPLLDIGLPGTFDDNGIIVTSIVKVTESKWYLYYVGFELSLKIRYRLLSGLAISNDAGITFSKISVMPILERSPNEMYFRGGPFCILSNDTFRLWYVAGSSWINLNEKFNPVYDIRYLESSDGIKWANEGKVIIPITQEDEYGFGRPYFTQRESGKFSLFYSIRKKSLNSYRLGYAESDDGFSWIRKDNEINLDVTKNSFDSDGIMYAAPIYINNKLHLFYNGNNFGADGIALAILEDS
jgi:hypothetical protein